MLGYLKHNILRAASILTGSPDMRNGYDLAIDSYLKELENIVCNETKLTAERGRARELLKRYRQVCNPNPIYSRNLHEREIMA